jgi:cysteine dioxygenase
MTLPLDVQPAVIQGEAIDDAVGAKLLHAFARMRAAPLERWPDLLPRLDVDALAPWLRFDRAKYTRVLLATDGWAEALLMGWLPGQASVIHDHGASQGFALVLAGAGLEHRYHVHGGLAKLSQGRRFARDDLLFERPGDVHRLVNDSDGLLATMHVYAPPLAACATYEADPMP